MKISKIIKNLKLECVYQKLTKYNFLNMQSIRNTIQYIFLILKPNLYYALSKGKKINDTLKLIKNNTFNQTILP